MPLSLTSREWAGLMAMKSHLRLSMETQSPALAHSHVPRASVGVAGLWTGKDAPGSKLCSVKFDKRPRGPALGRTLSFPLWDVNGLLALLEEGDRAEIEFLGIHTFFPHGVMFSTPSFAVLYSVIRKHNPVHLLFCPFSVFSRVGWMWVLSPRPMLHPCTCSWSPDRRVKLQAGEMTWGSSGFCSFWSRAKRMMKWDIIKGL